ncbi:MAG: DUF4136 domain-containing protein [Bacteroidetes bacterium]|nr:MAG: DUF4136 domain-containing protein [Bacteroidota bacterium]
MKKLNYFLALTTVLFVISSCEPSLKVTSDYDKEVNFSQYKTFRMVQLDQQHQTISQLNQQRIINAVINEMKKKGFIETADNPDLHVNAIIILQDKKSVTANTNYYGYGGYYRPYGWGGAGMSSSHTTYDVQNYKDGSLIIDVVDARTQKLLWEGIGNKEIDKPASDPDKAIAEAVASIMANFPPGLAKKK